MGDWRPGQCPRYLYIPGAPGWLAGATHIECRLSLGHAGDHRAPLIDVTECERDEMDPSMARILGPAGAAVAWESES